MALNGRDGKSPEKYCKIPIISPGFIVVQKAFWKKKTAYFRESVFWEGFIIEGNFEFQNRSSLTTKTS